MFWGITPSLDLLEELNQTNLPEEINILLIGGGDARHVLKTLSRRYRHGQVKLNFYLIELVPESYAKQLLLLNMALEPVQVLGAAQKTRIFMEIFGNMLTRPVTAKYLMKKSGELIRFITNLDYMKEVMPFMNIELKYKERDYIENVFKFWRGSSEFDILDCWDRRLRKFLGVRYDTKNGAFDWDLNMRLYHIGGSSICTQEYQSFRRNGVAFSWIESEVTKPNRSMVTGIIKNGDEFGHYGYLGDMQTGPFIAYGIQCDDEEYLKKSNNMNKYRSTDLTERNLREIFHGIEFQNEYVHLKTHDLNLGSCIAQLPGVKVVDTSNVEQCVQDKPTKSIEIDDFTVTFLSMNTLNMMKHKEQYKNFFHVIYFNSTYLKHLSKEILEHISSVGSLLIIEHQLFVLGFRDKELGEYVKTVREKIESIDSAACPFDINKDSYLKFILKPNN